MVTVAGSPMLDRAPHTSKRDEADALRERIERALNASRAAVTSAEKLQEPAAIGFALSVGLMKIVAILEGRS